MPGSNALLSLSRVFQGDEVPSICAARWAGLHCALVRGRRLASHLRRGRSPISRLRHSRIYTRPPLRGQEEASMMAPSPMAENLVIGGGPAGAMAAIKLAEAGQEVML